MQDLYLIVTKELPIYDQLQLEEYLFRSETKNYCLINQGSPKAIVLGRFGQLETLVHRSKALELNLPLIRRFSGGGTVVVDENTLFISFILNKSFLKEKAYPENVMAWFAMLLKKAFIDLPICVQAQDLCIENRKFAGQAQAFSKDRFVHHTTQLIDYNPSYMESLTLPPKQPSYRQERNHEDFLVKLKDYGHNLTSFSTQLISTLQSSFRVHVISDIESFQIDKKSYRKETSLIQ